METTASQEVIDRCLEQYAEGTFERGYGKGSRYERFNTPQHIVHYFIARHADLFKGLTIYDPCADRGRILDAAEFLGYPVKGGDILKSTHPKVEQKNLYDIDEDLSNMAIMTIFRWGDYRASLAQHMIEHLRQHRPALIFSSRCPRSMCDHHIEGYELVEAKAFPASEYIMIASDGLESSEEYWACLWKRL